MSRSPETGAKQDRGLLVCEQCHRKPRSDENPYDSWRRGAGGQEELRVLCPECFKDNFGSFVLLNLASEGELTASYVHGGPSEHLMLVYHRTLDAAATMRDGFRDRDYPLPGHGALRGVLFSAGMAAFGLDQGDDQGEQVVALDIPKQLFAAFELNDGRDARYRRAVIPESALRQLTLTSFEAMISAEGIEIGRELDVGPPGFALDEAGVEFHKSAGMRDEHRAKEKERRARAQEDFERFRRLQRDIDILFGAGDVELARSAYRSALSDRCAHHLELRNEEWLAFPDFRNLAYLLVADGESEAAAKVIEDFYAAFGTYPGLATEESAVDDGALLSDPAEQLQRDLTRLRSGVFEVPESFLSKLRSPLPQDRRTPVGSLFGALPERPRGRVRFVFIGGPLHYVDRRGVFQCDTRDPLGAEGNSALAEDFSRVSTMVESREWDALAIRTTHRLLESAQRTGESAPWTYSIGYASGWFREDVKALIGRYPTRADPDALVLEKPSRGRWLYDRRPSLLALHMLRGGTVLTVESPPTIAIWRWPDRSDLMLQAFCDTLAPSSGEPLTVVLPDTPGLYDFALRYQAKQLMLRTERTLLENLLLFTEGAPHQRGTACYSRFHITRVLDSESGEADGDVLSAALDFLDTNHQVRISPWKVLGDPLLRSHLETPANAIRELRSSDAQITDAERKTLAEMIEWYRWSWDRSDDFEAGLFSPHRPSPLDGQ